MQVEAKRLKPNTKYFYQFRYRNRNEETYSQIGATRTIPEADDDIARARIAFFGCSNLVCFCDSHAINLDSLLGRLQPAEYIAICSHLNIIYTRSCVRDAILERRTRCLHRLLEQQCGVVNWQGWVMNCVWDVDVRPKRLDATSLPRSLYHACLSYLSIVICSVPHARRKR